MKKVITGFYLCLITFFASAQTTQNNSADTSAFALPVPDHIVIAIIENHAYEQIMGDLVNAPYIYHLADSGALFTQSYGIAHPSQPSYLALYSGSTQNITTDNYPTGIPFNTRNMGACLFAKGHTFTGYAEDLPSVGYLGIAYGNYASKHAVYTYWQGTGTNHIPATANQPFTSFPSNYNNLPTVSYIIPNQNDDMHSGTVLQGDTWLHNHLDAYIQWAKTHNSLFILTTDEDDQLHGNHITTIFSGPMVKKGQYVETINHYNVLRTIEDIYGICHDANDSTVAAITSCWIAPNSAANELQSSDLNLQVYPNPTSGKFTIKNEKPQMTNCEAAIYNVFGEKTYGNNNFQINSSTNFQIDLSSHPSGIYFLQIKTDKGSAMKKIVISH